MNPQLKMPFKRYEVGNVWRDGPVGLARYRQFLQCDVDVVGCSSMLADAELIALTDKAFKKLGFEPIIKVNNRKLLNEVIIACKIPKEKGKEYLYSILKELNAEVGKEDLRGYPFRVIEKQKYRF